jgi:hypothetical protein
MSDGDLYNCWMGGGYDLGDLRSPCSVIGGEQSRTLVDAEARPLGVSRRHFSTSELGHRIQYRVDAIGERYTRLDRLMLEQEFFDDSPARDCQYQPDGWCWPAVGRDCQPTRPPPSYLCEGGRRALKKQMADQRQSDEAQLAEIRAQMAKIRAIREEMLALQTSLLSLQMVRECSERGERLTVRSPSPNMRNRSPSPKPCAHR